LELNFDSPSFFFFFLPRYFVTLPKKKIQRLSSCELNSVGMDNA
jgi:hypothetical protein